MTRQKDKNFMMSTQGLSITWPRDTELDLFVTGTFLGRCGRKTRGKKK